MSVAIKIGSSLAEQARTAAEDADRSLTGQIEHWARLGRAVEPILSAPAIAALKKSGGDWSALDTPEERARVLETLEKFRETPRSHLRKELGLESKPTFEVDPENPEGIVRVHPDGTRERGTLKGRQFEPS